MHTSNLDVNARVHESFEVTFLPATGVPGDVQGDRLVRGRNVILGLCSPRALPGYTCKVWIADYDIDRSVCIVGIEKYLETTGESLWQSLYEEATPGFWESNLDHTTLVLNRILGRFWDNESAHLEMLLQLLQFETSIKQRLLSYGGERLFATNLDLEKVVPSVELLIKRLYADAPEKAAAAYLRMASYCAARANYSRFCARLIHQALGLSAETNLVWFVDIDVSKIEANRDAFKRAADLRVTAETKYAKTGSSEEVAMRATMIGLSYFFERDFVTAKVHYEEALALDNSITVRAELVRTCIALGQFEEAVVHFKAVVAQRRENPTPVSF